MEADDNDNDDGSSSHGGVGSIQHQFPKYTSSPKCGPITPPASPAPSEHMDVDDYDDIGNKLNDIPFIKLNPDFQFATTADLANNKDNLQADIAKAANDLPKAHKLNETLSIEANEMLDLLHDAFGNKVSPAELVKTIDETMQEDEPTTSKEVSDEEY